jgi:hypothetical protein
LSKEAIVTRRGGFFVAIGLGVVVMGTALAAPPGEWKAVPQIAAGNVDAPNMADAANASPPTASVPTAAARLAQAAAPPPPAPEPNQSSSPGAPPPPEPNQSSLWGCIAFHSNGCVSGEWGQPDESTAIKALEKNCNGSASGNGRCGQLTCRAGISNAADFHAQWPQAVAAEKRCGNHQTGY